MNNNSRVILFLILLLPLMFYGCTQPDEHITTTHMTTEFTSSIEIKSSLPEGPDRAGGDLMKFDIYLKEAYTDIDNTGRLRNIWIKTGTADAALFIDDTKYALTGVLSSEVFAIADIDPQDGMYEIITGGQSSKIYRFTQEKLLYIDEIPKLLFDGENRETLDLRSNFDGQGAYYKSAKTSFIGDIYYMARFRLPKNGQPPEQVPYAAAVVSGETYISLKPGYMCALLYERAETYYAPEYNVIWDYASWPHINGREVAPEPEGVFSVITAGEEKLKITGVYGPDWFLLETEDGYKGYVSVMDGRIRGYDKVMYISIADMFSSVTFP